MLASWLVTYFCNQAIAPLGGRAPRRHPLRRLWRAPHDRTGVAPARGARRLHPSPVPERPDGSRLAPCRSSTRALADVPGRATVHAPDGLGHPRLWPGERHSAGTGTADRCRDLVHTDAGCRGAPIGWGSPARVARAAAAAPSGAVIQRQCDTGEADGNPVGARGLAVRHWHRMTNPSCPYPGRRVPAAGVPPAAGRAGVDQSAYGAGQVTPACQEDERCPPPPSSATTIVHSAWHGAMQRTRQVPDG
jgi:hypothetical protein